ncbi:MAG: glycoside hydrolase family 127 protein [Abditibacteriota bacterium]|nr:glycoside hydrolase family 127 protein [Abditibacteriota bacterium]
MKLLCVLALCCICAAAAAGRAFCGEFDRYGLRPLDYRGVTLKGELGRQFEENSLFYLNIDNDSLLKPYRERAGLPAPGEEMGGVYLGHGPFGQFLAGYARCYAATGDEKYREKALYLMREWGRTIEEDGFFLPSRQGLLGAYQYEKLMGGLADIYHYCNAPEAKEYMDRITDWAEKNLPRTREYCDVTGINTGEWYTLSENLYRVWLYTGDERYRDFAKVWEYTKYWTEIHDGDTEEMFRRPGWHHGYSHVNTFASLGTAYAATGNRWYLDTLKAAYDFVTGTQCYATGGFGASESLMPSEELVKAAKTLHNTFETQCGSWAAFKIVKYLTGLTGEGCYGDWTEKLLINGIGASLPMKEHGVAFYYSDYAAEGAEKISKPNVGWPCCSGTRAEAVPDYHDQLYYYDDRSIYVSQYFASEARFELKTGRVSLEQITDFPNEEKTVLVVSPEKSAVFSLKFRIPSWNGRPAVRVNGRETVYSEAKGWGLLVRRWDPGDRVEIDFPMSLWACRLQGKKDAPWVLMYGPVALVCMGADQNPFKKLDADSPDAGLVRGEGMTWRHKYYPELVFKPFYDVKDGEKYYMYIADPTVTYMGAVYKGGWEKRGSWMSVFFAGPSAERTVWGDTVRVSYYYFNDNGIMDVYIDGEKKGEIDLYKKDARGERTSKDFDAGSKGKHLVRIVTTPRKNPEALQGYFNLERIEGYSK